jgi:hypothetical protein
LKFATTFSVVTNKLLSIPNIYQKSDGEMVACFFQKCIGGKKKVENIEVKIPIPNSFIMHKANEVAIIFEDFLASYARNKNGFRPPSPLSMKKHTFDVAPNPQISCVKVRFQR